jgi:hypothetical protein
MADLRFSAKDEELVRMLSSGMKALLTGDRVPISMPALIERINHKLAARAGVRVREQLRVNRTKRWWYDLGDYYLVNVDSNHLVKGHVDPEELGQDLGMIHPWEEIIA